MVDLRGQVIDIITFDRRKWQLFAVLLLLMLLVGFIPRSSCETNEAGIEECRNCGAEGYFIPVLRPFAFLLGNLYDGLHGHGDLAVCNAIGWWMLTLIPDLFHIFFLAGLGIHLLDRFRAGKGALGKENDSAASSPKKVRHEEARPSQEEDLQDPSSSQSEKLGKGRKEGSKNS